MTNGHDEIIDYALHAWLCGCRLLMVNFPAAGAHTAECALEVEPPLPTGWSKHVYSGTYGPVSRPYWFYDTNTNHVHRHDSLPEGVDESNIPIVVHRAFANDARTTRLFQMVADVADELPAALLPEPFPQMGLMPKEIVGVIAEYAQLAAWDSAVRQRLAKEEWAWSDALISGKDAGLMVATGYMCFGMSGREARHLLTRIYELAYDHIPRKRGEPNLSGGTRLLEKAEQLYDTAYRLFRARTRYNVSGFYNGTYFAMLCATTVMTMADAESRSFYNEAQWRRLLRLGQNADELVAHYLAPSFTLPAVFNSQTILGTIVVDAYMHGVSAVSASERHCLHPGLTSIFSQRGWETWNAERVHARYVENVRELPALTLKDILARESPALSAQVDSVER
jgi:hypothetical protein